MVSIPDRKGVQQPYSPIPNDSLGRSAFVSYFLILDVEFHLAGRISMKNVSVIQRFLPHYRMEFYKTVTEKLLGLGFELHLLYGQEMETLRTPVWGRKLRAISIPLRLGEMSETFVFMPGVFSKLWRENPDLLILEDLAGLPNTIQGVLYARLHRIP